TYSVDDGTPTTAIPERTDAGTYSIKAILSGADNYKGSVSASAKINKKKITDSTIKIKTPIATQYYTGSAVTLSSEALVIYDGDESNTLLEGTDFTTEYKNNNAAGTATVTIKGKGNYDESSSRSVNFVIKEYDAGALNVLYNGTTKAEWYSDDVKISADGYLVSDSRTREFADNYSLTGSGTVTKTLYFKDKTNGAIPAQEITVKIDRKAPSGKIEAVKESWTKFQNSKKTAAYTNEQKSVTITGSDSDSKVDKIQYFISDTFYSGQNQAESAGKGKWETYSSSAKPGLSENSLNYIYAKVTDKAGNTFYLSSEGIWYDTKAPKVTTVKATPKDTSTTVQVKATDTKGSGVKFVYVLVKKKDESKPTAKTVQSSGKKKELSKEDGKDDFEITGLTAKTGYVVYTVAEDFCKNLSEVKETKITTKETSSSSSSGTGGAGNKNAAAGADGAGGSNAAKRGVSSDSAKKGSGDSASENEGEGSDGIKNKVPFIDDASEGILTGREYTSGWDKIENEALSAQAPAEIHIEMNGATVVPAKMLNDIADRDVTMYFEMGDGIIWAVNGLSFTSVPQQDIDFKVKKNTKNIPSKLLTEVADVYPHTNLTLSHDGNFGFTA
ncbi:MAG: hypothetical protein J6O00_07395, partial [Clostridiales bacterium]|nr:hypothetical protein [Clostridiales bacterium]